MPQQGFLRVWKYKSSDLHNIQRHNERGPDTRLSPDQLESIDQTLTHLNVIRMKSDKSFLERCEARIAEIDAERAAAGMRRMYHGSMLTLACEFIVSMPDVMDRTPSRGSDRGPGRCRRMAHEEVRRPGRQKYRLDCLAF